MIGLPPFEDGAAHETRTASSRDLPRAPVGAPGTVAGITGVDGLDGEPVPIPLVAVTVNVYEVPLVRPVTVQLRATGVRATGVMHVLLPGELSAV